MVNSKTEGLTTNELQARYGSMPDAPWFKAAHEDRSIGEPVAPTRASNPLTSYLAGESVRDIGEKRRAVLDLFKGYGPMHDEQLVKAYAAWSTGSGFPYSKQSPSGLRTRRSELVSLGFVRDSGRRGKTASGRTCCIWEAV